MLPLEKACMKVFVTGIYNSGKTTLAKHLCSKTGARYIDFDSVVHKKGYKGAVAILASLPDDFVMDAIPFEGNDGGRKEYKAFRKYCSSRAEVEVRCCVVDKGTWRDRSKNAKDSKWDQFHRVTVPELHSIRPSMTYWKNGTEVSREEAAKLSGFRKLVLDHARSVNGYDWKYQDAPELGVAGYSATHLTWQGIKSLGIQVKGRSFVDVGCNHAYVLFRLEEEGAARLIGLDAHKEVVLTARAVAWLRGSRVRIDLWDAGQGKPIQCDCTLVLNALHHFPDPPGFLSNVRSPELLFEGKGSQLPLLRASGFEVVKNAASHRRGRVLALARKRIS